MFITRTITAVAVTVLVALVAPGVASAAPAGGPEVARPQGVSTDGRALQPGGAPAAPRTGLAAADPGPRLTRAEMLTRARTWADNPVPYSREVFKNGYRTDCSGYVSMAWHTDRNYWTGDLDTIGVSIGYDDLRPGDMLLYHNPENPVNGSHVVLFDHWTGAVGGDFLMYEQTKPSTKHRTWSQAGYSRSKYKPFRYVGVIEDAPAGGSTGGQSVVHDGYTSEFTVNAADGHLQETFLARLGGAWGTQDLSASAGTPAVAGQPVAVVHDGYVSVFTVNAGNGHLQETFLARLGGAWVTQDLGALAGAQAPSVMVHDGYVSVFTVTPGGQLQETYLARLGAAWATQSLPASGVSANSAAVLHDGYVSVFTVGTGGQLRETFLARLGGAWTTQDLGAAAAVQAPAAVVHDGYVSVFTVTSAGQAQETYLARLGTAWGTQPLPATGVTAAPAAAGHDGYVSVFTVGTGGQLRETYLPRMGAAWVTQDLGAGTPSAAGRPAAVVHDGYVSVFTVGATGGHVSETYLPRIGAAWASHDLTSTAGTPAARP
ncbi:hypothetical protein ACPPVO_53975 [Dactylosporangium sp. McL0621]|uniref:hypothetical protein n=1 Tax=Dactylosporangium sp. McL0621 TaxID=3415678 RepID=UPI003CF10B97